MKVLVAYRSITGNTKKIAEAIFNEIQVEKEIKGVDEVASLEGYDLARARVRRWLVGLNFNPTHTDACKGA